MAVTMLQILLQMASYNAFSGLWIFFGYIYVSHRTMISPSLAAVYYEYVNMIACGYVFSGLFLDFSFHRTPLIFVNMAGGVRDKKFEEKYLLRSQELPDLFPVKFV